MNSRSNGGPDTQPFFVHRLAFILLHCLFLPSNIFLHPLTCTYSLLDFLFFYFDWGPLVSDRLLRGGQTEEGGVLTGIAVNAACNTHNCIESTFSIMNCV